VGNAPLTKLYHNLHHIRGEVRLWLV